MNEATDPLSRIFFAFAHPLRRDILARLEGGAISVGEIASAYDVSRPAVSQHLGVLEAAGLIERTVHAQWRVCSLRPGGMVDAAAWIAEHRAGWSQRFDLLEQLLAPGADSPKKGTPR
ncbi:ArsR/SmtB family transcription factor [Microbacterium hibisci]|uniref:ArsR/SmtB family transcription factor n=1 Tax=Microbacterium hibisci TaxID=2036000 RepID=UPI0019416766|nr:metalloregulator ArsR/SmtB family transcription factor [Microbacterium hibisci]